MKRRRRDEQSREVASKLRQQFESRLVGKILIEENDPRPRLARHCQTRARSAGVEDIIALALERLAKELAEVSLVVDDQEERFRHLSRNVVRRR